MTDYAKLSDAQLAAADEKLAAERTRIRLAQNELHAEQEMRRAFASMSSETRRIVRIRLDGETSPSGTAASAAAEG